MNCRILLLLLLFSVFSLFSNAQEGQEFLVCNHSDTTDSHVNTNLIESYKITVDMKADQREIPSKIYLYAYKMGELALVDSAKVKGKKAIFRKKQDFSWPNTELLQSGFYKISLAGADYPFILNSVSEIEIVCVSGRYKINKPVVNKVLWTLYEPSDTPPYFGNLDYLNDLEGSFLQRYFYFYNLLASFNYNEADVSDYEKVLHYYDFSDARFCNSSEFHDFSFTDFLRKYLSYDFFTTPQLKSVISFIIDCADRGGDIQANNYISLLFNIFLTSGDPFYEPLMLDIYDNYDKSWIPEEKERSYKRIVEKARRLSVGSVIPELTAYDIDGNQHSTKDITTKYTVLWFWDPDCDHCQEQTPILHQYYNELSDSLDFEVFAVEVNDDYDRWKAFSEKHELNDWINLSTSMGEPNVDFIDYFDIVTTPVVLLIDNSDGYAIKARQISLEEIIDLMKNNTDDNEK